VSRVADGWDEIFALASAPRTRVRFLDGIEETRYRREDALRAASDLDQFHKMTGAAHSALIDVEIAIGRLNELERRTHGRRVGQRVRDAARSAPPGTAPARRYDAPSVLRSRQGRNHSFRFRPPQPQSAGRADRRREPPDVFEHPVPGAVLAPALDAAPGAAVARHPPGDGDQRPVDKGSDQKPPSPPQGAVSRPQAWARFTAELTADRWASSSVSARAAPYQGVPSRVILT